MMFIDWQTLLVAFVVTTAGVYVARRLFKQVKSLTSKSGDGSCGCGSCGSATANKQPGVVQITRQPTASSSLAKRR